MSESADLCEIDLVSYLQIYLFFIFMLYNFLIFYLFFHEDYLGTELSGIS